MRLKEMIKENAGDVSVRVTVTDEDGVLLDSVNVLVPKWTANIALVPLKRGEDVAGAVTELVLNLKEVGE